MRLSCGHKSPIRISFPSPLHYCALNQGTPMGVKVCKFGGTSLADASQVRKVQAIIQADPTRRYVVPSAPGKRTPDDHKITDLLYLCHAHAQQNIPFDDVFKLVAG